MTDQLDSEWHVVANMNEVDEDEPLLVQVGDNQIALCKIGETIHAIDDICTHEFASLSEGFVEGDTIECPLHQAMFHIPTGKVLEGPAEEDVRTYPVKVVDGRIHVKVTDD